MAEEIEQQVQKLENSIIAHKGHLTTRGRTCERAREFLATNPTSFYVQELEEAHAKYKEKAGHIEDLYIQVQEIAGAESKHFDTAKTRLVELEKTKSRIVAENMGALMEAKRPAARRITDPPAVNNAQGGAKRVNEALKPTPLTKESSPEEFRSWVRKFKSYYSTSQMQTLPITDQQSYLFSAISVPLETHLTNIIGDDTPIFGENDEAESCINYLKRDFLRSHPVFLRRQEFFSYSQVQGQKFSTFVDELKRKGAEADLRNLSHDDLYVFRIIGGCTNEKITEKLLDLKEPTLLNIEEEGKSAEATALALQAMKKGLGAAVAAQAKQKQKHGNKNGTKSNGGGKKKYPPVPEHIKGRCFACGNTGHRFNECRRKGSLHCSKCNKDGHVQEVCFMEARSRGPSRHQSRAPSRQASRSPSPRRGSPSPERRRAMVVRAKKASSKNKPTPKVQMRFRPSKGQPFDFAVTPDTGATRTIIAHNLLRKHRIPFRNIEEKLYAANGTEMKCQGSLTVSVQSEGGQDEVDAIVSSDLEDEILLSWHDLIRLGVLPGDFPAAVKNVKSDSLEKIKKDFQDVLSNTLDGKYIKGEPMKLEFKKDVTVVPKKITTARAVPIHWQPKSKRIVGKLVDTEAIEKIYHQTDWISPAFFVEKDDGELRLVTDFQELNKYLERPVHPFPSSQDIIQDIQPDSRFFAKLDAVQGYYQVPLDEKSADLTTFLLPDGKYRYKVAPMGIKPSSDVFCSKTDPAIEGLPWAAKIVDDILIQAPSMETLLERIRTVLERCRQLGITISLKKLEVGPKVKFAGHIITDKGVKPDPEKIGAIKDFPVPENITGLRSFIGLANQLANFLPELLQMMTNMRQLLKKGTAFLWLPEHQEEFQRVKDLLTSDMMVKPFDRNLPTELLTDASRLNGLGYLLMQRGQNGQPRIIRCGSCALTPAQKNYATIELECLAVQWAMNKCAHYLRGMNDFTVVTDHKPLVGVFAKPLHMVENARLQRLREKMIPYNFKIEWKAGKQHCIADALSRAPVFQAEKDGTEGAAITRAIFHDKSLDVLKEAAKGDSSYQEIIRLFLEGDIKRAGVDHPARAYQSVWDNMSYENGLLFVDGTQAVVPATARKEVLRLLHLPHAGQVKTRQAAKQLYFWPGINSDIKNLVEACNACANYAPRKQKEVIQEETKAFAPMSHVGADLFDFQGQTWITLVDRYSGFPFAHRLTSTTTSAVTKVLREWFMEWGIPSVIRTDGGPQFRSEFRDFCKKLSIEHELSSPYNPRSNGLAEAAVKNMKTLLKKCSYDKQDFREALLEWRNVPRADGVSPAQLFLGRRQKTNLPQPIVNRGDNKENEKKRNESLEQGRRQHDKRAARSTTLQVGETVRLLDPLKGEWNSTGRVIKIHSSGKSFDVKREDGKIVWRNSAFLKRSEDEHEVDMQETFSADTTNSSNLPTAPRRSARLQKRRVSFDDSWEIVKRRRH